MFPSAPRPLETASDCRSSIAPDKPSPFTLPRTKLLPRPPVSQNPSPTPSPTFPTTTKNPTTPSSSCRDP